LIIDLKLDCSASWQLFYKQGYQCTTDIAVNTGCVAALESLRATIQEWAKNLWVGASLWQAVSEKFNAQSHRHELSAV